MGKFITGFFIATWALLWVGLIGSALMYFVQPMEAHAEYINLESSVQLHITQDKCTQFVWSREPKELWRAYAYNTNNQEKIEGCWFEDGGVAYIAIDNNDKCCNYMIKRDGFVK